MRKYYPEGDPEEIYNVNGYTMAQAITEVLRRCRNELTRENVMRQVTSLKDLELPMLLPPIKISTSPEDYNPVKQIQPARFDGSRWVRFGNLIGK